MAVQLNEDERKVLEVYNRLTDRDGGGAWACFYHEVLAVVPLGDIDLSYAICQRLKQKKLLDGQGRGKLNANYWISDKGKAVVEEAA